MNLLLTELLSPEDRTEMKVPTYDGIRILGITCDSRSVDKGYLFAAIPGEQRDGRQFIAEALDRGASAILAPPGTSLKPPNDEVPLLINENPRRQYALMAARFFPDQPQNIACVTGTNGKTSVVSFLRQIWAAAGYQAASIGTLGIEFAGCQEVPAAGLKHGVNLTTPDSIDLHRSLAEIADAGFKHLSLEASSHGLSQYRLDGVRVASAAFTNLTRDHLDYHGNLEEYLLAKLRLFSEIILDGGTAIINADIPEAPILRKISAQRGLKVIDYGYNASDLKLLSCKAKGIEQAIKIDIFGERRQIRMPFSGAFQASNALAALGLALSTDVSVAPAVQALSELKGVQGRMELAAKHPNGASIYVDYAHTPAALKSVLAALRPHATGMLHLVFGCGGNRDSGKRAEMGRVAEAAADCIIVTDDNPRHEDPGRIRRSILAGCPSAREIGDRSEAIAAAVSDLKPNDILVITGKGHESVQNLGDRIVPFDDVQITQQAAGGLTG